MKRLYRCYGCLDAKGIPGKDFECDSTKVVCPGCGIKKDDEVGGAMLEPLNVIHYEPPYPHPVIGQHKGCGYLACDPLKPSAKGSYVYSGDPRSVNCTACKETEAFRTALGNWTEAKFDLPATVKPDGVHVEGIDPEDLIEARKAPTSPVGPAASAGK